MALLFECTQKCCRKQLDTADIVREAIFHQLTTWSSSAIVSALLKRVHAHGEMLTKVIDEHNVAVHIAD
jgi:hypothetical protein